MEAQIDTCKALQSLHTDANLPGARHLLGLAKSLGCHSKKWRSLVKGRRRANIQYAICERGVRKPYFNFLFFNLSFCCSLVWRLLMHHHRKTPNVARHLVMALFSSVKCHNSLDFIDKSKAMLIERTSGEVIIRLPASVDTTGLQGLVDYLTYKEATANSKATQEQVDKLAFDVKKGWWKKNRKRFIK